jgi:hypothetical protein
VLSCAFDKYSILRSVQEFNLGRKMCLSFLSALFVILFILVAVEFMYYTYEHILKVKLYLYMSLQRMVE